MMKMYFHLGYKELILFKSWETTSVGNFVASFIGLFIISVLYEALKGYRDYLSRRSMENMKSDMLVNKAMSSVLPQKETITKKMLSFDHGLQSVLHLIQVSVSYCLMLVVMTYNVWLCLAVVLGSFVGYFLFGWQKSSPYDNNEHCN